jgi:hypothetical protein
MTPRGALRGIERLFLELESPSTPMYSTSLAIFGAATLDLFPFLPLGGNLSIGVAAPSYEDAVDVGFRSDGGVGEDLEVLAGAVDLFSELALLAGADDRGRVR